MAKVGFLSLFKRLESKSSFCEIRWIAECWKICELLAQSKIPLKYVQYKEHLHKQFVFEPVTKHFFAQFPTNNKNWKLSKLQKRSVNWGPLVPKKETPLDQLPQVSLHAPNQRLREELVPAAKVEKL